MAETAICLDFKEVEFHSESEPKVTGKDLKLWVVWTTAPAASLNSMIQNALVPVLTEEGKPDHTTLRPLRMCLEN